MTGPARLLIFALSAWLMLGCARAGSGGGLLAGRTPSKVVAVQQAQRVSDGVIARAGDPWESHLAAVLSPMGSLEWDLGQVESIRSLVLQGDQNDEYVVRVSEDGVNWIDVWRAPRADGRGLQSRSVGGLDARARFVRVAPAVGDGKYSISELAIFSDPSPPGAAAFSIKRGMPIWELHRSSILLFGLSLVLFLLLARRGSKLITLAALGLPIGAAIGLYSALSQAWPVGAREVSMVRAVAAFVALAAIAREFFAPKRYPASKPAVIGVLGVSAVMALAGFFNLGHPQFYDAKNARPNLVHNHDMRVYYPVAKYFKELRFDGVYLASVAAFVDDVPGSSLDSLSAVQLRDLRTHEMRRVGEVKTEIEAVRRRFTPERWQSFVQDMRYFRQTMGERVYLDSMTDHGGNATPVWLGIAHLIFAKTHATNPTLIVTALLDPLLLLLAFGAIWRCFGVRTMLISAVVFGANDFYMFGSNWAGATLRHDWMAYLALGACALKRQRWLLGGALLALSAMIRAFPAFALVGVALPAGWWLYAHIRRERRLPRWSEIKSAQRPLLMIALGAGACVAVFFLMSSALLSFSAWGEWLHKVSLLDRDPHTNHVSLRGLVAGNDSLHMTTLYARMPLFIALAALLSGLIVLAARGKDPARAALLGTLLIPIAFNPANYYIHFIFVLPLLAADERALELRDFAIWATLLAICVLQYWTVLVVDWELHFQLATVLLFAGVGLLLAFWIAADWRRSEPQPTEAE